MKIFVVNCGSSSVKYQLFDMADESVLAKGALERVGTADAVLRHTTARGICDREVDAADHAAGLRLILDALVEPDVGVPPGRVNLIIAHLGNGCSMTAIAAGKAVDHSMGMTPMDGLMMGTRCGSLDPGVVLYMLRRGMTAERIDRDLNGDSWLLGVSGHSNDMRDILAAAQKGQPRPELAIELFVYRIVKYAASFYAILPGVDALVLTGGIGENSPPIRRRICDGLARLGAEIDERRNDCTTDGAAGPVSAEESRLPVWVVPTNEELMIARDTRRIIADGMG